MCYDTDTEEQEALLSWQRKRDAMNNKGGIALAIFNIMKDSFSISSLSLPFAMLEAGLGFATLLILLLGFSSLYTSITLVSAARKVLLSFFFILDIKRFIFLVD